MEKRDTRNPSSAVSIENVEKYSWGGMCDGWRLLQDPDLSVIQERVPPSAGEVAHFHEKARQFFYVLKGSARIEFEEAALDLHEGQGVHVAPGVIHRFLNPFQEEVIFLVISSPETRKDRIDVPGGKSPV